MGRQSAGRRTPAPVEAKRGAAAGSAHRSSARYRPRRRSNTALYAVVAVAAALVVVVLIALSHKPSATDNFTSTPVPPDVLSTLTAVPAASYDAAGTTGVKPPMLIAKASRPAVAPGVLYIGAEFCPFCAAQRWVLITALSRFGTFSGLQTMESRGAPEEDPNTPTFTFLHATFTSSAVQFQTSETADRAGKTLQTPTDAQQSLLQTFDAPPYLPATNQGTIPFVLVGGTYIFSGSSYDPSMLAGKDWSQIADSLATSDETAKTILGNANIVAAAICATDGATPAAVCNSKGVQAAAALLPTVATQ